ADAGSIAVADRPATVVAGGARRCEDIAARPAIAGGHAALAARRRAIGRGHALHAGAVAVADGPAALVARNALREGLSRAHAGAADGRPALVAGGRAVEVLGAPAGRG